MNIPITLSKNCFDCVEVKRSWWERLFTLPWHPFQKTRQEQRPGMYRVGDKIEVHPDRVGDIYKLQRGYDDAPTLKIKVR